MESVFKLITLRTQNQINIKWYEHSNLKKRNSIKQERILREIDRKENKRARRKMKRVLEALKSADVGLVQPTHVGPSDLWWWWMMMSQELKPEDKRKKLIITDATKRKVNTHTLTLYMCALTPTHILHQQPTLTTNQLSFLHGQN